jgi:hypothetical protein
MDSNPEENKPETVVPAGSQQASEATNETTKEASTKLTTGFTMDLVHLGASILRSTRVAENLQHATLEVIHVPKVREHLLQGYAALAQSLGLSFAALADMHDYDRAKFYDACAQYLEQLLEASRQTRLAQKMGMSLEDFQKRMAEGIIPKENAP